MFLFVDGRPVVLTFAQLEQRYYASFVDEFPQAAVSLAQWRGGYEYQTIYPAIQQMIENGMMTLDALNEVLGAIAETNQAIYRPAVLHSRVAERFAQDGIDASIRVADATTKGIVAICVDQTTGGGIATNQFVGELIRDEILPAGQHMEGPITYETELTNGQPLTTRWINPTETLLQYRLTFQVSRNSQYPVPTVEEIQAQFLINYSTMMGLGYDVTPQAYMTTAHAPWASSVLVEYSADEVTWATAIIHAAYTDRYLAEIKPVYVVINP